MTKAYGSALAQEVARAIIESAQKVPNSPLKKLWLYGSIAKARVGRDIDLVLEVDLATFDNYADRCEIVLEGVRPISDDLLHTDYNPAFSYFSAAGPRGAEALAAIGVNHMKLHFPDALYEALDIVCLPEGWDDAKSEMHRRLINSLAECDDPNFLERVIKTRVQLFPRI